MAPGSKAHKAEAKYGVAMEYPDLQLHSAAANGNVGLVKYALMHGQPVNSVLNGVLPIHIAASSGNEQVVSMLIDAGADVNAARLPSKYIKDRSQAVGSIGASGSTPLHFAAANGHANVVSLLLSHGANPNVSEKHGLTPEDLAKENGHINVLTVLRLWKQSEEAGRDDSDAHSIAPSTHSIAPSIRSNIESPIRKLLGKDHRSATSSASSIAASTASNKKLLTRPSLDSLKSRKLGKAASSSNLAGGVIPASLPNQPVSQFPAPAPLTLRQNPQTAQIIQKQPVLPSPKAMHQIIAIDKARRPSLPAVFEKAAHSSHSIKQALGMTPANSAFGKSRSTSSGQSDHANDPYHFARPHRSTSKTSVASLFRPHHSHRDRSLEAISQPLSPAASSFFTADDDLEQAERDDFISLPEREVSSSDDTYLHAQSAYQQRPGYPTSRQGSTHRSSTEHQRYARSRAGSGSSAATTASGYGAAPFTSTMPFTAPPTQSTFFPSDALSDNSSRTPGSVSRPFLTPQTSAASLVIPSPIPAPPTSSTQPFFSKAAISAAHNNPPIVKPGFYRPRKSSQLSTKTSMTSGSYMLSPDLDNLPRGFHALRSDGSVTDDSKSVFEGDESVPLAGPSVVIRRPTIRDSASSYAEANGRIRSPSSPTSGGTSSPPNLSRAPSSQTYSRHSRASSDGTGTLRTAVPPTNLPDLAEDSEGRQRSQSNPTLAAQSETTDGTQEVDPETAEESHDTFPTDQERPFISRSRAGSRARPDGLLANVHGSVHTSPNVPSLSAFTPYHAPDGNGNGEWHHLTRPNRSGSTGTDTRTSRSGSTGEGPPGHAQRFFGFDYSSSPASTSSFYQPSNSTTATSLVGSSTAGGSSKPPSEGAGTTVTHAQAKSIVKQKEEELLSYDPTRSRLVNEDGRRSSLSQQLASYGEAVSIERELSAAERMRKSGDSPVTLMIPDPPASAKYSWEILGKQTRTPVPLTSGQRTKDRVTGAGEPHQHIWTHKMVSPFEVPLPRRDGQASGHRHTLSSGTNATISSSGKALARVPSQEPPAKQQSIPSIVETSSSLTPHPPSVLRPKPSSNLSISTSYLSPTTGGSDVSATRRPPRTASISPAGRSPRTSSDRERLPSTSYHIPPGQTSDTGGESANSSTVSEPRSFKTLSNVSAPHTYIQPNFREHRHKHSHSLSRSDPPSKPHSPDLQHTAIFPDETPRPERTLLKLETVTAPKYHIEQKAGGDAAPTPTKSKFKFGSLFK